MNGWKAHMAVEAVVQSHTAELTSQLCHLPVLQGVTTSHSSKSSWELGTRKTNSESKESPNPR